MDDYQNYIQSGSDQQDGGGSGGCNMGCGTIALIIIGVVFAIYGSIKGWL